MTISMFTATVLFSHAGPWETPAIRALGMIESGENDKAIGKHGEVSRYQITPKVWKYYSKDYSPVFWRDFHYAATTAYLAYGDMRETLSKSLNRQPTASEMYIVWNAGHGYFAKHKFRFETIPSKLRERAMRYDNLVLLYTTRN